jgi:hypothetical protein
MEMPTPEAAHERFRPFVGRWSGSEKLYPSSFLPEGATAQGHFDVRLACDGFFLVSDYREEREGRVEYRGHGVYGYDPKTARYSMYWFDSMGGMYAAPVPGRAEGSSLVYEADTPRGRARFVHEVTDDGVYHFRLEVAKDGAAFSPVIEGAYTRQ